MKFDYNVYGYMVIFSQTCIDNIDGAAAIPYLIIEWDFLQDQCGTRKMYISSGVDPKTTNLNKNRLKRKNTKIEHTSTKSLKSDSDIEKLTTSSEHSESTDTSESCYKPVFAGESSFQNRLSLQFFVGELDRYEISDRAGAALATALMKDLDMIDTGNTKYVTDKNKIRRERQILRNSLKFQHKCDNTNLIKCIGFDGKKDKNTKVLMHNDQCKKYEEITEEHIVFTNESSKTYITHSCLSDGEGTGHNIAKELIDVLREYDSSEAIEAIVCDGTWTN